MTVTVKRATPLAAIFDSMRVRSLAVFGRKGCARRAGQGQHGGKHREPEGLHGDCHPHDADRPS